MTAADDEEQLKVIFQDDDMTSLLLETGFRKAIQRISTADAHAIISSVKDYHCLIKVTCDKFDVFLNALGPT